MGKASLAVAIANQLDVGMTEADANELKLQFDLTAILTNLRQNQILLITNIHRLDSNRTEKLVQVVRDGSLTINIGMGPAARDHVMEVRPFTFVATCLRRADCPPELFNEFSLVLNFAQYSEAESQLLAQRIATSKGITLDLGAAEMIARASNGRPADLETTIQRLARAMNKNSILEDDVLRAFAAFGMRISGGSAKAVKSLSKLTGQEFEVLISSLLVRMGFHTEMTRATGDGGVDIIAHLDKPVVGGRYLFQCKRFAVENRIGEPAVRDFYGAVTADRAVKGILITTSEFTSQAREFGMRAGIELIGSAGLEKLLTEHGLLEC